MASTGTQIAGASALVTGGNRGFGRAVVQELLDRGAAKVYATARSPFTVYATTPLLTARFEEIQAELDTNLFGLLRVTRAFAPILGQHESSLYGHGHGCRGRG